MTASARHGKQGVLLALAGANFASVYAMVAFSPVLSQLSADFEVSTGTAGLTLTAFTLPGIVLGLVLGPFIDRNSPRPFLIFAGAMTGLATVIGAVAPNFAVLLVTRFAAGVGAAMLTPSAGVIIGGLFEPRERGRAFAITYGANALANVVGLPLAGILAEATSWRVATGAVGLLSLGTAALVAVTLRESGRARTSPDRSPYRAVLADRSALALLAVIALAATLQWSWAAYVVVYFQHVFGLSQSVASALALTSGLGVLIGSQLGGRLSDRFGHRRVVLVGGLSSAVLLPFLVGAPLVPATAALLNLLLLTILGARSTAQAALITTQALQSRATMFALAGSFSSGAIALAAAAAGGLIDDFGFGSLGLLGASAGLIATLLIIVFVREEPRPGASRTGAIATP